MIIGRRGFGGLVAGRMLAWIMGVIIMGLGVGLVLVIFASE
jgi:hypothetical protein